MQPRRRPSRDLTVSGVADERAAYVHQQLEIGKLVADSTKREKLTPQRATRELYIAPGQLAIGGRGGLVVEAIAPPALPPLGVNRAGFQPKRPGSDVIEQNRALKQRSDELAAQNAAMLARLEAMEREVAELRTRTASSESAERQLRSDMKHIVHRNQALERANEQLRAERERAEAEAEAKRDKYIAQPPATDESNASTAQASPLEAQKPPRPSTPQHTHTFLSLVEKGLTRELERAAVAQENGEAPSPARTGHQISLRTQLRQLADMQKEVSQLQKYTEAIQTFSDNLTRQLRSKERDNVELNQKLSEKQREAEATLIQLSTQLHEAQQQLAQAHASATTWEEKATSAQVNARHLADSLTKSESALGTMREHMERMLTLHEGLTEAAIGLGHGDSAVTDLINELDRRLGGSAALEIADQLDDLIASGGSSHPPRSPATHRLIFEGAPATAQVKREVAKTRSSFMVARRYLLSTRQKAQFLSPSAGGPGRSSSSSPLNAGFGSPAEAAAHVPPVPMPPASGARTGGPGSAAPSPKRPGRLLTISTALGNGSSGSATSPDHSPLIISQSSPLARLSARAEPAQRDSSPLTRRGHKPAAGASAQVQKPPLPPSGGLDSTPRIQE